MSTVVDVRLGGADVIRAQISHGRKARNDLVALNVRNANSVIFVRLVELDHGGVALTIEDGDALSKKGLDIAAVNLVNIHRVLVNRKHQSFKRSGADKFEADPAIVGIDLNDFVQSVGWCTARVESSRNSVWVGRWEIALCFIDVWKAPGRGVLMLAASRTGLYGWISLPLVSQRLVIDGSFEVWKLNAGDIGGAWTIHSTPSIDENTVHTAMR